MKVAEKKKAKNKLLLSVTATADEVDRAFEAAQIAFAQQMGLHPEMNKTIPEIVQERLGIQDLDTIVATRIVEYLTPFAIDKKRLSPAFPAKATEHIVARRGFELEFTVEVTLKGDFRLASYSPVTISLPPFAISEEEVDRQVAQMADLYSAVIDDAWIRQNAPEAKTLAGFRDLICKEFEKSYRDEYEDLKRQLAVAELAKRFTGEIDDEAILAMQRNIIDNLTARLRSEGTSLATYIEENGGEQQFNLVTMMQGKELLTQGYALDALFQKKRLCLTDEDIREACRSFDPENPDLMRKQMEYSGCGFLLIETAERLRASTWLLENACIIEEHPGK